MYTYENELNRSVPTDPELCAVNPILLDILFRRGFKTDAAMRDILFPDRKKAFQPLNCQDIDAVLSILENAVQNQTAMAVYHNYDTDGIAAGAVATHLLGRLGVPVHPYANSRKDGAFGICQKGIAQIQKRWPETELILTAGTGIMEHDAIDYANRQRLTVVVTDHHEPGAALPDAAAAVDLKRSDEIYPYQELCGCGLIFRIMLDLYRRLGKDLTPVLDMLDLVALAAAAAEVPLTGENRTLVQQGMKRINLAKRPFFQAMAQCFHISKVNTHKTIHYSYAPLINSVSRMGEDTGLVIEAMLTQSIDTAEHLVSLFSEIHQCCKEETKNQLCLAKQLLKKTYSHPVIHPVIIVWSEEFSVALIDLIAGKLKELYRRPVIVLASPEDDDMLKGFGRSTGAFSLSDAFSNCSMSLSRWRGDHKSAEFSLLAENLDSFAAEMMKLAHDAQYRHRYEKKTALDAVLEESDLTEQFVRDLGLLEPFSKGFPEPIFGLKMPCDTVQYMGSSSQHIKYTSSSSDIAAIGWNQGKKINRTAPVPHKFVGKPSLNFWNHQVQVQFIFNVCR